MNPILDAYAFVEGAFEWDISTNFGIQIEGYLQPFTSHVLDVDVWKSVNYPTWWTNANNESNVGDCYGIKTTNAPLHAEINFAVFWP